MLCTLITSLFFFLVSLAAPTKPGFIEHNVTRSDGTVTTVYFHESFVPDEKAASPPSTSEVATTSAVQDIHERFIVFWYSVPWVGPFCTLSTRTCSTTDHSALWDDCVDLMTGFDNTPGYWNVSYFQSRNNYGILGFYNDCIISLARDDDNINDYAQISTVDVTTRMRNAGRSCGIADHDNIIHVGATIALNCPNRGGTTALLKLWIHSRTGEKSLPGREEPATPPTDQDMDKHMTAAWIHSTAGALDSDGTKSDNTALAPAGSGAVEPPKLLTMVWNAQQDHEPKCSMGSYTCKTKRTSPTQDDCVTLRETLYATPGFWNLSSWPAAGGYDEIVRHQSCVVYLARPDRSQEEAQFAVVDAIFVLSSAWYKCNKEYDNINRMAAVFQDFCPNLPSGTATINVKVDSPT